MIKINISDDHMVVRFMIPNVKWSDTRIKSFGVFQKNFDGVLEALQRGVLGSG